MNIYTDQLKDGKAYKSKDVQTTDIKTNRYKDGQTIYG